MGMMGLSYSKDPVIVAGVVLTQCQRVTDGQTDGRTVCVASRGTGISNILVTLLTYYNIYSYYGYDPVQCHAQL